MKLLSLGYMDKNIQLMKPQISQKKISVIGEICGFIYTRTVT